MGSVILLVVAAVWVAVLVPPLVRSRWENRPNSSVSDFRAQLSSLQRAMPSSRTVRGLARPLAPSPVARPSAAGRPPLRSGIRLAGGGDVRSPRQQAAMRPARPESGRVHDVGARQRTRPESPTRAHATPRSRAAVRDARRQRRANVLFVLVLTTACTVFLAVTTGTPWLTYAAVTACVATASYVAVLAQAANARRPARPRRPKRAPAVERAAVHHDRRERAVPAERPAARRASQVEPVEDDDDHVEWYDTRRTRRTPARATGIAPAERTSRQAAYDDWGYDPTPSGNVYGEPALFAASSASRRRHRSTPARQHAAV